MKRLKNRRKSKYARLTLSLMALSVSLAVININLLAKTPKEYINPVIDIQLSMPQEVPHIEKPKEKVLLEGKASYYSHDGCLGCSVNQTMANGDRFNEKAMTLAIGLKPNTTKPLIPLNTYVLVRNLDNGKEIKAKVTDTGGFYTERFKYRVADLSKGLAEALDMKTNKSVIQLVEL